MLGSVRELLAYVPYMLPAQSLLNPRTELRQFCSSPGVEAEAPNRLVYRVTQGGPIRNHRGEGLIEATDAALRLTWTIDFIGKVPGTGPVIELVLDPTLRRSIDRIAEVLAENSK